MPVMFTASVAACAPDARQNLDPTAAAPQTVTISGEVFRNPAELQAWFSTVGGFECTGDVTSSAFCAHPGDRAQWRLKWAPNRDGDTPLLSAECDAGPPGQDAVAITDGATFTLRPATPMEAAVVERTLAGIRTAGLTVARIVTYCPRDRVPRNASALPNG